MRTRRDAKRVVFLGLTVIFLTVSLLMWLRSTPASAQASSTDRLREAREALEQANLKEKSLKAKEAGRATEAALREYNAAIEARVAEIFARVKKLDELMGGITTSPFDVRDEKSKAKAPDPALRAEYEVLQQELAALQPGPLAPGNVNAVNETESNDTCATADVLDLGTNRCRVACGTIPANLPGDKDFWSFTAPAGSRVWAYVDTGGGQSSPANDRDSFLTLLDTNCVTILEVDDDDGTGNGCDSGTESGFASTISGRTVAAAGTYFLVVEGFGPSSVINPYRLTVVVTTGAGTAEVEPNGMAATANPILGATQAVGHSTGSISPSGDMDFYSVVANAGDVFYVSGDGNPERDALNTDLVIDFIDSNGTSLMNPPADSGLGGAALNPEGEAFCMVTPMGGTYFVKVSGFGASTGTYGLMVARCSTKSLCPVTMFTGILGMNSTSYPGVSGTQNGRLNRFIDQTGACKNIRPCPGIFTNVGARPFDAYTFTNSSTSTTCVTVEVDAQLCVGNNFLVVAAYLGPYDPTNQCVNYLADIGGSPNPIGVFSFNVPAGATFVLVITSANPSPTVCATPYKVTVLGLSTFPPGSIVLQDDITGSTLVFNTLTGDYMFTNCATGLMVSGQGSAISFGCFLFFFGQGGNSSVSALANICNQSGTANISVSPPGLVFNINDSNITNNSCFCP